MVSAKNPGGHQDELVLIIGRHRVRPVGRTFFSTDPKLISFRYAPPGGGDGSEFSGKLMQNCSVSEIVPLPDDDHVAFSGCKQTRR